jgi:hypothetical protein
VVTASPDAVAAITVEVEEGAPYNVAYDVRYNQEDAFNLSLDGQVQNLFGRAITLGARVQAGRWIREGRFSVHLPTVWRLRDMTVSVFDLRQTIRTAFEGAGTEPPPLDVGERLDHGLQLQQSVHRFHPFELLYGYRYHRLTCPGQGFPPVTSTIRGIVDPCDRESLQRAAPLGPEPIPLDVGALDTSIVRDTATAPSTPRTGGYQRQPHAGTALGSDRLLPPAPAGSYSFPIGRTTWAQKYSLGTINTFREDRLPSPTSSGGRARARCAASGRTLRTADFGREALGPGRPSS